MSENEPQVPAPTLVQLDAVFAILAESEPELPVIDDRAPEDAAVASGRGGRR